jgi:transposase
MVAESFTPGASVSTVAQRYGVNANLLFTWRRATSSGAEQLELVPVRVADERAPAAPEPVGRMEIVLTAGERILVGVDVDAAALARVVKALSRR